MAANEKSRAAYKAPRFGRPVFSFDLNEPRTYQDNPEFKDGVDGEVIRRRATSVGYEEPSGWLIDRLEKRQKQPKNLDVELGTALSKRLLNSDKAKPALEQAAEDPEVAGMFAAQTVIGVRDKMIQHGLLDNDLAWAKDGGVLDNVILELSGKLEDMGVPMDPKNMKQIWDVAVRTLATYDQAGQESKKAGKAPKPQGGLMTPENPTGLPPVSGGLFGGPQ